MRHSPTTILAMLAAVALAACNSSQDVLNPSNISPPSSITASTTPADPGSATAPIATPPAPNTSGQNAAAIAAARIQFAPIVGPSVEAATALSERLASRARERGMTLTGNTDTTTTHVMKGYFTPLTEGKQTTIIYVWDVYDPAGTRVHRISGQEKTVTAGGEGWQSVPAAAMRTIAASTIDQLADWLAGRTG